MREMSKLLNEQSWGDVSLKQNSGISLCHYSFQ